MADYLSTLSCTLYASVGQPFSKTAVCKFRRNHESRHSTVIVLQDTTQMAKRVIELLFLFAGFLLRVSSGDVVRISFCARRLRGVSHNAVRKCVVLQQQEARKHLTPQLRVLIKFKLLITYPVKLLFSHILPLNDLCKIQIFNVPSNLVIGNNFVKTKQQQQIYIS